MSASSGCRCSPRRARRSGRRSQAGPLDELVVGEDVGVAPARTTRPLGHHDRASGVLGDELHVVRHDEDGRALVVELAQQREKLVGARAILPEGRLVEREHGRAR